MGEMVINGSTVEIGDCATVLEVARKYNIEIPTLCYHPSLEAYGACRLCVVEVLEGGRPGLAASCVLPAVEGLKIETHSKKVLDRRRMIVQLLLSVAPDSEVLQKLSNELGIKERLFENKKEKNCILCGLCVRACKALGNGAISFAFRGPERKVCPPFDEQSELCMGCLACVNVCPVNAISIQEDEGYIKIENWSSEFLMKKCAICGRSFATEKHMDYIQERYGHNEFYNLCPECRKRQNAALLL